ncbi:MAG: SHOCT domain-containing protein [Jatrophihabitantaceae bacterium]
MAIFRGRKPPDDKTAEAFAEAYRSQALARQSTEGFERTIGMDVASVLSGVAGATHGGGMEQMLAYRDRAARIFQRGVEMPATLGSVVLGQHSPILGGIPAQVQLTVEPPGAMPYAVNTDQVLHESMAQTMVSGQRLTVKVDPDDPQCLMIWGVVPAATAPDPSHQFGPAAGDDGDARLAKLAELRRNGVLTDEEFEAQKARMLSD